MAPERVAMLYHRGLHFYYSAIRRINIGGGMTYGWMEKYRLLAVLLLAKGEVHSMWWWYTWWWR